jgi:hypothetical protein
MLLQTRTKKANTADERADARARTTQHFELVPTFAFAFIPNLPLALCSVKSLDALGPVFIDGYPESPRTKHRQHTARMGKSAAKKTRKFGAVKRMLAPTDMRLKANQEKAVKKEAEKKEAEVRHVSVPLSRFIPRKNAPLPPSLPQRTTPHIPFPLSQRSSRPSIPRPRRYQFHQPLSRKPHRLGQGDDGRSLR